MAGFASPLYDLDARTGFIPPKPPLLRLFDGYERWELLLDDAKANFVNPGPSGLATATEKQYTANWRKRVTKVSQGCPPKLLRFLSNTDCRACLSLLLLAHRCQCSTAQDCKRTSARSEEPTTSWLISFNSTFTLCHPAPPT